MSDGRPARIGINAVFLLPGMGGLDTYVRELVPELLRAAPGVRFTVYCSPTGEDYLRSHDWAVHVQLVSHPLFGARGMKAATELTVLGALAGRHVDVLHSVALTAPLRTRAANVVMIADTTWFRGPAADLTTYLWRAVVPTVARRADRLIAISQAGARDIVDHLRVPRDRVDVTLLGHAPGLLAAPVAEAELRRTLGLGAGPLVLTVGTRKPHKNIAALLEAFAAVRVSHPDAMLALAGNRTRTEDDLHARAQRLGIGSHVRFLPFVDDATLEGLYAAATCFVLPSLNEGFGLPVLEAMGRGVPVACSQASALPEVAADAARYFDPVRPDQMAVVINDILADPALRARLSERGRARERELNWAATASATLDSWERAWHQRRSAG